MPLEQQVCSLESAKKIKELGCKQESLFYWANLRQNDPYTLGTSLEISDWKFYSNKISAFTVAELGELLVHSGIGHAITQFVNGSESMKWVASCMTSKGEKHEYGINEVEARAKCLIYLLENGLITL